MNIKTQIIVLTILLNFNTIFSQHNIYGTSEFSNITYINSFNSNAAIAIGESGKIGKWNGKNWNFKQFKEISQLEMGRGWFADTNFGFFYGYILDNYFRVKDTSYIYNFNNNSIKFAGFKKSGRILSIKFFNKDKGAVFVHDSGKGKLYWYDKGIWSLDTKFKCKIDNTLTIGKIGNLLEFNNNGDLYVLTNKELQLFYKNSWYPMPTTGGNDLKFRENKGYLLCNENLSSTVRYFDGVVWQSEMTILPTDASIIEPFNMKNIWSIWNVPILDTKKTTNLVQHYQGKTETNQFPNLFPEITHWISMHDSLNGWICGDNFTLIRIINGKPTNYSHRPTLQKLRAIHMKDNNNGICVGDSGSVCIKIAGKWSLLTHSYLTKKQFWTSCYMVDTSEFLIIGKTGDLLYYKNKKYITNVDLNFSDFLFISTGIIFHEGKFLITSSNGLYEFNGTKLTKLFVGACGGGSIGQDNLYYVNGTFKKPDGTTAEGLMYMKNYDLFPIAQMVGSYYMFNKEYGLTWAGGKTFEILPVIGLQELADCAYPYNKFGSTTYARTLDGRNGYYVCDIGTYFFQKNKYVISNGYNIQFNPRNLITNASCINDSNVVYACSNDGFIFSYHIDEIPNYTKVSVDKNHDFPKVRAFPNPTMEKINILNLSAENKKYFIVNIYGKAIQKGNVSLSSSDINLKELLPGVYFIKIDGFETLKIIKIASE